jgi:deoxyribonucleoside regulator
MDTDIRNQLLADIATLYFKEKKTQEEIAQISGYSRSAISRFLSDAEQQGVVEFIIKYPLLRDNYLENRLKERFVLESAFVINSGLTDHDHNLELVGRQGANYFQKLLHDDLTISIGWGSSLYALVSALPFFPLQNTRVVQVIGAVGAKSDRRVDGPDIASFLANKLSSTHHYLPSPAFLDSENATRLLKKVPQIHETLEIAYQSNIALLGVGTIEVDPYFSSIYRTGFLGEEDINQIQKEGGVCNFCGVILDANGVILDIDINKRSMSADIQKIRSSGCKIVGIAAGAKKTKAIEAVLNGNWLDALITDKNAISPIFQKQNLEV